MELNVYIGQKIKDFRKLAGMTQTDLAQRLETTKQTISRYEKGDRKPGQDTLFELTDIFKVSIDDFFPPTTPTTAPNSLIEQISDKVVQLTEPNQKNVLRYSSELLDEQERGRTISDNVIDLYDTRKRINLPVPGKVSAGTGYWQEDDYDTMVSFYEDDIPDQKDFDTIAIAVGHSMEPKIKNGDFLFIKFTPTIDLNKIGIFQIDGENYVKKLKSDHLESLNKDYDNIQITEGMRTIGEVVDVYREG
ncbi:helix-turn-helix domain-containing protein [Streptococcus suis]|uniref:helix-turn-helix domain-containing protein n=1 Tax=Streptococcus suis TaxID=1307 RepID=UPI0004053EF6|nr:XRE family transcriptional regulator [Streptococcus suis]